VTRCVVVGSGAREHALAWALAKNTDVVVTPGNDGIAAHGIVCVETPATELEADMDRLRAQGKTVVGPGARGAALEGSKAFMKEFLAAAGVPTAAFATFSDEAEALTYLASMSPPYVVKTDGLAAGKGVLVTDDFEEASRDVLEKIRGLSFGAAGTTVIIEEGLDGQECSLLVLCDGTDVVALVPAQDFKRVGDGDAGANTGGMGAFAPMAAMSPALVTEVMDQVVAPTVAELKRRGIDFRGVLYAGVMLTSGGPKLLEYNVRFGDPEAEVLVPLYGDGLYDLLARVGEGRLAGASIVPTGAAVTVVLASHGYPQGSRRGDVIAGLGADGQLAERVEGVTVFHAGTALDSRGRFVTDGGRVLAVTGVGATVPEARRRAYEGVSLVNFEGRVMRSDIALGAI
jgi:phosphoribosylamine--glycine ligase